MIEPTLEDVEKWIRESLSSPFDNSILDQIIERLKDNGSYVPGDGWKDAYLQLKEVPKDDTITQAENAARLNALLEKVRVTCMLMITHNVTLPMADYAHDEGQVP